MIERLVRDGAGVGVTMVVTASHERGLPMSVAAHLGERLLLPALRPVGVSPRSGCGRLTCPTWAPVARSTRRPGSSMQLLAPPSDVAAVVAAIGERWPAATRPPRPVAPPPTTVTADDLLPHGRATGNTWWLPIGLGRTEGDVVTLPLRRGESLTVCGPTGRERRAVVRLLLDGVARLDPTVGLLVLGPGPVPS